MNKLGAGFVLAFGIVFYFVTLVSIIGTGAFSELVEFSVAPSFSGHKDFFWPLFLLKILLFVGLTSTYFTFTVKASMDDAIGSGWQLSAFFLISLFSVAIFFDHSKSGELLERIGEETAATFARAYANTTEGRLPTSSDNDVVFASVIAEGGVITVIFYAQLTDSAESPESGTYIDQYNTALERLYCNEDRAESNVYVKYGVTIMSRLYDLDNTLLDSSEFDFQRCSAW